MTLVEFRELQAEIQGEIENIMLTKGREYPKGRDQLENFKSTGTRLFLRPETVLYVFLDKHIRSIEHYCVYQSTFSEPIESRILDAIVYLHLLRGLIRDEKRALEA